MRKIILATVALIVLSFSAAAKERVICTVAIEIGSDKTVLQEGECNKRISSASTFKVAISLMGFDSGIFTSLSEPKWPFKEGYVDWNPKWRQVTTPQSWMRDSVVWFSQLTTERLGAKTFEAYVDAFDYGNGDVSGDVDKDNGLTHAWLSSSLQISPREQVDFLTRMIEGKLPVDPTAVEQTKRLMQLDQQPRGWHIYGKTGAGLPFSDDGELLKGQPFGWYVGWAEKDDRTVVFARLLRFSERPENTPGAIARDGLLSVLFGSDGALK
ncbi:class D beta-lactamase [Paracoccus methylarcula]|nr:class D beta-lactamase [Paracoccus methylarcula]